MANGVLSRGKYRNPNGTLTAAALRARRPYAARNAALGMGLLAFCGFGFAWAYRSFSPDDFSDLVVPPLSEEQIAALKESPRE